MRPSSLPLLFTCSGSLRLNLNAGEELNDDAALGTAVHRDIAAILQDGRPHADTPSDVSDDHRKLVAFAISIWNSHLAEMMPNPIFEYHVKGDTSCGLDGGTIDVVQVNLTNAIIVDWKTGMKHGDHIHQMEAYAYQLMNEEPTIQAVTCIVVHLRHWMHVTYRFTREDVKSLPKRIINAANRSDFVTGPHCSHCPARNNCPAYKEWVDSSLQVIGTNPLVSMSAKEVLDTISHLGKRITDARRRLRQIVEEAGGSLQMGDGSCLTLDTTSVRQLVPEVAYARLSKILTADELRPSISMSISAVEDALKKKHGLDVCKEAMRHLEECGGIVTYPQSKLVHKEAPRVGAK